MITSKKRARSGRLSAFAMSAMMLGGCSILTPVSAPAPSLYSFDSATSLPFIHSRPLSGNNIKAPTLVISVPRAAAGFDSHRMAYMRHPHQLEYFRQSEWIAVPGAMLSPLIVAALERSGQFGAVVQAPTSTVGQLRLDVEIIRLQQEFFSIPSQVHVSLRAHLLDATTRQVIAWREFDVLIASASEDPYGGVIATNRAISVLMQELTDFCTQAVTDQSLHLHPIR